MKRRRGVDIFRDERGFTTFGTACAILCSCALLFACVWVVRSQSRSAGFQSISDTAALAAENEVAEFVVAVRVADAVLLSMSLTGIALLGVGTVCCCVPQAAPIGVKLIDAAEKFLAKRADVAKAESKALNAAQKALPVASEAQAQMVIRENAQSLDMDALGYVELVNMDAPEIGIANLDASEEALETVEKSRDDMAQAAQEAEKAAAKANEALMRGYMADCGSFPDCCMAERAQKLSGITSGQNPICHSVNTWSFSMALDRARAYYQSRVAEEAPEYGGTDEMVRSVLRKRFYAYAVKEMQKAFVHEGGEDEPSMLFPLLPSNTSSMKRTPLYTEAVYPVADGALHAWAGCPGIVDGVTGMGSLAQVDSGGLKECEECQLRASSMGKVAAASTSIENGFEYHYRIVAKAADDYCEAKKKEIEATKDAKSEADGCFDAIEKAMKELAGARIEAFPPGRFGSVALVTGNAQSEAVPHAFVGAPADLGSYQAISAAVLVEDESEDVVASLLDGAKEEYGSAFADVGSVGLALWSGMLNAHKGGVEGVRDCIKGAIDSVPLIGLTGLGQWAADKFMGAVESVGLEPARTKAAKAVLVNTSHVVQKGDGPLAMAVWALKESS